MLKQVYSNEDLQSLPSYKSVPIRGCKNLTTVNNSPWWFGVYDDEDSLIDLVPPFTLAHTKIERPQERAQYRTYPNTSNLVPISSGTWNLSYDASFISRETKHYNFGTSGTQQNTPVTVENINALPLTANAPVLVGTIPYSDFTTASSTYYQAFQSVMQRNARQRAIAIVNGLNEDVTSVNINPYDSTYSSGGNVGVGMTWSSGVNAGFNSTFASNAASNNLMGLLGAPVDSFQLGLGMGSTLPTSGSVTVYVSELL